jgi:hypothetical protein
MTSQRWIHSLLVLGLLSGACGSDGSSGETPVNVQTSETSQVTGDTWTDQRSVERMGAGFVEVDIDMAAGELALSSMGSGTKQLLDARFVYSEPEWKPEVSYGVNGTEGKLEIRQGDLDQTDFQVNSRNEWTLRLSPELPMDMKIEMGAGRSHFDLRGLDLGTLEVSTGAGQGEIDLSGEWRRNVQVAIDGGAGQLSLTLPEAVGVRLETNTAVGIVNAPGFQRQGGAYVNDAFGVSPVTMTVTIELGAGVLDLRLAD